MENRTGCAFVVFQDREVQHRNKSRLADGCTVFQAELLAIKHAVSWASFNCSGQSVAIFSDSRSSLEVLQNRTSYNSLASDTRKLLDDFSGHICLVWTRAHVGTVGNEVADQLAKEATREVLVEYSKFPMSFAIRILRQQVIAKWNQRWRLTENGSTTKVFFPTVGSRQRWKVTPGFQCTQVLTGHGCFNAYLAWRCLQIEDRCVCGVEQTSLHLIQHCPATAVLRFQFEWRSGQSLQCLQRSVLHPEFVQFVNSVMQMELHLF
ncbi:unnamed protein product [Ectocarpus sp. 12 AP-2014]